MPMYRHDIHPYIIMVYQCCFLYLGATCCGPMRFECKAFCSPSGRIMSPGAWFSLETNIDNKYQWFPWELIYTWIQMVDFPYLYIPMLVY